MGTGRSLRLAVLAAAVCVHAWLAWTIVRQPLDPNVPPATPRSPVWRLSYDAIISPGPGADFFAVYHAGVQVSRGASPYGLDESPQRTPYFYVFRYHPLVAETLGRAAATLPPGAAYRLWALLTELLLAALAFTVANHQLRPWVRTVTLAALLVQFPYLLELHMGQFTFVAAGVAGLAVVSLHRWQASPPVAVGTGVLLSAVAVLKQFPLFVIAGLVASRTGRRVALAAAAATAFLLSPLFTSAASLREYAALNLVDDTVRLYPGNLGLLHQVFATSVFVGRPLSPAAVEFVAVAGALIVTSAVAAALYYSGTRDIRRTSGTMLAAFFLAYFRIWEHHYSAVMVAGVLVLLGLTAEEQSGERGVVAVLLVGLVLLAAPTVFTLLPADPRSWRLGDYYIVAAPKIAGTVCVVLAGVAARPARTGNVSAPRGRSPV